MTDDRDDELQEAVTSNFQATYFSNDERVVWATEQMLLEADEFCHLRMALSEAVNGKGSDVHMIELATHTAVVDLRLRVSAHLKKLRANTARDAKQEYEARHAAMKASIQLLYIAEPPEFLEVNGVDEPLDERHADLLASWLLGEGWKK